MKVGLLLEGGAMRGIYTAGVLDVWMKNKLEIDTIMGVSAGALFGMNYKSKQPGRVLRYNKKYAKDKRYMGWYSFLTTGNIMNAQFCFQEIANQLDPVDFDTFKNSKEEFYAVVTNMQTGKAEYIKIEDLKQSMEYLRASGSMPFVSKPVVIEGKEYLDGGIADSIPIDKMMSMGFDKIMIVLTRPLGYRKTKGNEKLAKAVYKKYPQLVEAINKRYILYNQELDKIAQLEEAGKVFVLRPSKLIKIKRLEKDERVIQEMYDLGVSDANQSLTKLKHYLETQSEIL